MRAMPTPLRLFFLAAVAVIFSACARSLPKYETPIARAQFQSVRTTAYTHSEADHICHGRQTALGTTLRYGKVHSAAADWSRWPAGTVFRILETGEVCEVDDFGWALAGRNTIDLYKPSRAQMNSWGVRRVNIQVLNWGDPDRSLSVLRPRGKHRHVRKMIAEIEDRRSELLRPVQTSASLAMTASPGQSHASPLTPFTRNTRN